MEENKNESMSFLEKIKSKYILKTIFQILKENKSLYIVKINKLIQNKLDLSIKDYKNYTETKTKIIIEIKPKMGQYGEFINIHNSDLQSYFHIYFNDNKKDIKKFYINKDDNVEKIKIIINYQIKSFCRLFSNCKCIRSIKFIQFYRKDIEDMSWMFAFCSFLKEVNLSNLKTDNVTNMGYMFFECSELEEINLSNLKTDNVTNMSHMFFNCSKLKEINLSNLSTNKVIDMSCMFFGCIFLKVVDLSHCNLNQLKFTGHMFHNCSDKLIVKAKKDLRKTTYIEGLS